MCQQQLAEVTRVRFSEAKAALLTPSTPSYMYSETQKHAFIASVASTPLQPESSSGSFTVTAPAAPTEKVLNEVMSFEPGVVPPASEECFDSRTENNVVVEQQ